VTAPDQDTPSDSPWLVGLGIAGGEAMIETLQHRVSRVPERIIPSTRGALVLRLII